jgi:DNA-binding response OmpR family regulator
MSFIQKPILPGPLLAKIREVLDRKASDGARNGCAPDD